MLVVDNVSYSYGDLKALDEVSITIEEGEIVCLLGPSGCGKTTLLRVITGLEKGYTGDVLLNGADMRDVPVNERDFGLMFQDFALFPHMSVADNVAYGLKRKGKSKNNINQRVEEMLGQVSLAGYDKRDVNMLSGGQKQRVALARSLAPNPGLLMLDEPLGSLDALLRDQLVIELRETIQTVGLTAVYVTHDQKEAFSIADRIAVMSAGQIVQIDTPRQIYEFPRTAFVAQFLGLSNILSIDGHSVIDRLVTLSSHDFTNAEKVLVHPNGIALDTHANDAQNIFNGTIESIIFRGEYSQIKIQLDGVSLRCNLFQPEMELGESVSVVINPDYILPLL